MRSQGILRWTGVLCAGLATLAACNSILDFDAFSTGPQAPPITDAGSDAERDADASPAVECTTNAECLTKLGDFSVCRKSDFKCTKLLAPECPRVLGDWKNDDAVLLGAINPIFGADAPSGIPLENAIKVAIDEFAQGAQGLPPKAGSTKRRPIAVVSCTETTEDVNDDTAPVRSATHLATVVKVPAIIGASYSGNTLRAAQVTIPAGTLLISPTATSVALTDVQDKNLLWRTSPSDVIQSAALAALMGQVESTTHARMGLVAGTKTRVTIIHKGDAYGKGLASALQVSLRFNNLPALENGTDFQVIDYGDPDSNQPPTDYPGTISKIQTKLTANAAPHVIFLLGTNEIVAELMNPIEKLTGWPATERPTWLFADGGAVPDLWTFVAANDGLRKRILGSIPGTSGQNFSQFRITYNAAIKDGTSPDVAGTANAYDALYLLAYAMAATANEPLTGASIAKGLTRLVPPGDKLTPGATTINSAFSALASGRNIDYDGASGPLNFDITKGEAESDIQIWCLPPDGVNAGSATPSGIFYDAANKAIGTKKLDPLDADVKTKCGF